MDLRDKVAVITGGKRIGQVVARELASRGMDLVLSYRGSKQEADETVSDVQSIGRRGTVVAADVSKPADCEAVIAHALGTFGRVDVLVNMASIYRSAPLDRTTAEYWGGANEIAKIVALLCETDFITGETIRVDGGRHLA